MTTRLSLDIGSNSVGSAWLDFDSGDITTGVSIFPAGVEESDEKRGDPKNAKRRSARRTRITLARRAARKRDLRLKLITVGLLPAEADQFRESLEQTDPWELRCKGLHQRLEPHDFGRILLHLAQRRGAIGFDAAIGDKGLVKAAITKTRLAMLDRFGSETAKRSADELRGIIDSLGKKKGKRTEEEYAALDTAQEDLKKLCQSLLRDPTVTFGRFIADLRDEYRTPITTPDRRKKKLGPREWRRPVRNRAGRFEFHADRTMIRDEFAKLWEAQSRPGGALDQLWPDRSESDRNEAIEELRKDLDNESGNSLWRHRGLLFGQRRASWDPGTLGRCVLEPTERCAPHADMHASRYLVVETVNNIKVIEGGTERSLHPNEREKIKNYLSGPLGVEKKGKRKGQPKRSVTVSDLRELMGWGSSTKRSRFRFKMEDSDGDREINTDWFRREIVHGVVAIEKWEAISDRAQEGLNRATLKHDPDEEEDAEKLKALLMQEWAGLTEEQAEALVQAWRKRPRLDAKRLNMSRRAVRNLLTLMDREEPWPDPDRPGEMRWLTQIEARKLIAKDEKFRDPTTGETFEEEAHRLWPNDSEKAGNTAEVKRRRYATGAKGATARDRHYMRKHLLMKNGEPVYGPDGLPLREPPPAPLISNPVARKAIHEVRRHLIEYMVTFGRKPDEIYIELSREARMGKEDADRHLFMIRLRQRIRNEIIHEFGLESRTSTQQREAVRRVVLCVQQGGICPLCGNEAVPTKITERMAAYGEECEIAHIIPSAVGGDNRHSNIVLAHTECNRRMRRRTPREFWEAELGGGFEEAMRWVEDIYGDIQRIKPSETKTATGIELWKCYFTKPAKRKDFFTNRDDRAKIEQFKKDVADTKKMTLRQEAATRYATRQVMAYLADAVFDGRGLPERSAGTEPGGDKRRIFATDGLWTSRLRREWGLFFDPHGFKAKGLSDEQEQERKEKDRGDHHHHAIDAVVIALCSSNVQIAWEEREKQAERAGVNTADEEAMDNFRRQHRLSPPAPFNSRDEFRDAVSRAVFGGGGLERPVSHRPVKRKLIGALHKDTLFGPVFDANGKPTANRTARKSVLDLDANHLRLPHKEAREVALKRLTAEFRSHGIKQKQAKRNAEQILNDLKYMPRIVDSAPGKSGIVRDVKLRDVLRQQIVKRHFDVREKLKRQLAFETDEKRRKDVEKTLAWLDESIDLDKTGDAAKKKFQRQLKVIVNDGPICMPSGVPIHSVVLLRTMNDPVIVSRWATDYETGQRHKVYDASTGQGDPAAARAYDSQNNHHIEIRVKYDKKGNELWSGRVVTAFQVAQQLQTRLRKLSLLEKPNRHLRKRLTKEQRKGISKEELEKLGKQRLRQWKQALRNLRPQRKAILDAHPLIDRSDSEDGRFVMSLCEGEMLLMRHKSTRDVGFFVLAEIEKNKRRVVLVPHWDARSATGRKDTEGKKVPDSKRDEFAATATDLKELAPPGHRHAMKVRVSALGKVAILEKD